MLWADLSGISTSHHPSMEYMFDSLSSLRFFRLAPHQVVDFTGLGADNRTWIGEDGIWNGPISGASYPQYPHPSVLTWYGIAGSPTSVSFDANGGSGTAPGRMAGSFPLPQQTLPSASGLSRPGYRAVGWSSQKDSTSPEYGFGQRVFLPLDAVDTTLYAVWKPLPKAGLSNAVTPTQPTGEAGRVKLDGTVEQGAGVAGLLSGDKGEVSLMHAGKESSTLPGDGTVASDTDTSLDTANYKWASSFPVSDLAAMDPRGLGTSYTFRMRVNTTADGNSEYAFASKTLDVVAPVVTGAQVGLGSSGSGGRLALSTKSSGDATQAVVDSGATVTVEWVDGSGNPLSGVPSSGPTAVDSSTGGWAIDVPAGVPDGGYARITVKDAAGNSSQEVNADGNLVRLQFPVTALPMTGAGWRSQLRRYLPLALAAVASALVIAAVSRLRHRAAISLR